MTVRSTEKYHEILQDKTLEQATQWILKDLTHYRNGGGYEGDDVQKLANAIEALVQLRQEGKI